MEDKLPDICHACCKPKEPTSRGSITQWIFKDDICTCSDELISDVNVENRCLVCGGVPNEARGSMTQWIFGSRGCQCIPRSPVDRAATNERSEPALESIPEPEEEIHFSPNHFPLERYTPLKLIGTGSSGAVYKCFDGNIRRVVAVKLLRLLSDDAQVQFQQEAKITSQLVHPCALQIMDFNLTAGGVPYMVTEYFESESLREYLTVHGVLPPRDAVRLFSAIADLLQFAHERGIFHRDLKPENILLTQKDGDLAVKLIDFGLAKLKPAELATTQDGNTITIAGTPAYMSPEQWKLGRFDGRSDIYSLGCVMFETLSGRPVFQADSPLAYMLKHQTEQPPSLANEQLDLAFGEQFDRVIARCLVKNADDRYKNPKELLGDLTQIPVDELKIQQPLTSVDPTASKGPRAAPRVGVVVLALSLAIIPSGFIVYRLIASSLTPSVRARVELDSSEDHKRAPSKSSGKLKTVLEELPGTFPVTPPQFKKGKGGLWLATGDTTDDALKIFASKKIDGLGLSHKSITGSGFKYLAKTGIERIFLSYSTIPDEGLVELAKIDTLKTVFLDNTDITDKGIENLIKLKSLRFLDLSNTAITDQSLKVLARNAKLDRLIIEGCKLSKEALKSFKEKLPECDVLRHRKVDYD